MKSINVTLLKKSTMKFKSIPLNTAFDQATEKINNWIHFTFRQAKDVDTACPGAYRALVEKEIADHIKSWRFLILVSVLLLVGAGAIITAFSTIKENLNSPSTDDPFFFLRLFTAGESGLPSFHLLINLLGPLLGISLAFDAINAEQIKGTANRILAQPIPRDFWINAKFTAALLVLSVFGHCPHRDGSRHDLTRYPAHRIGVWKDIGFCVAQYCICRILAEPVPFVFGAVQTTCHFRTFSLGGMDIPDGILWHFGQYDGQDHRLGQQSLASFPHPKLGQPVVENSSQPTLQ